MINQSRTNGNIYLHSMPGKKEPLSEILDEIKFKGIRTVISLNDRKEIAVNSPDYLALIDSEHCPLSVHLAAVPDFGVPASNEEIADYRSLVAKALHSLESGSILIHCGAGVGRTGTFAVVLLRAAGVSFNDALEMVREAGSNPKSGLQLEFSRDFKFL